jgi:very-short-patch-repair endonuclease
MTNKHDWGKIQEFYDAGHTWREIKVKFGVVPQSISKAKKRGDFVSRNHSRATKLAFERGRTMKRHSKETKEKISKARIKYLTENPHKVPYLLNHSSKKSYPEQIFENALISSGIAGWTYAYQHGIYEYDFAWPEQKIDVEIDGSTHLLEHVKMIDARRDEFSKEKGWVVLRFTARQVKKDVMSCIAELRKYL